MFTKQRLAVVSSAVLAAFLLGACAANGTSNGSSAGSVKGSNNEKVTLTLWQPDTRGAWVKSLNDVIASFKTANPNVTINNVVVPWADINTKVQAAKMTNTLPDLIYGWGGMLSSWAWAGITQPSDVVIDKVGRDKFAKPALQDLQVNNKTYGVPIISYPQMLWYRADMFKTAGISDPNTWTSWKDVSQAAKTLTHGKQFGFVTFNKAPEPEILLGLMGTNDTSTFGPKGDVVIDNSKTVEALSFLKELNSFSPAGSMANSENDARLAFTDGCCAMMISSPSLADVVSSDPKLMGKLKGAQFPTNTGDRGLLNAFSSIAVSATTKHADAANAFLAHWLSKDVYAKFSTETVLGFLPVTSDERNSDAYWTSPLIAPWADSLRGAAKASEIGVAEGQTFGPNKCSAKALSSGIWEAMGNKVTIGGQDPAAVANWAQGEFTKLCGTSK